jgi:hypothetical protein
MVAKQSLPLLLPIIVIVVVKTKQCDMISATINANRLKLNLQRVAEEESG